jgi:hypothetical protein
VLYPLVYDVPILQVLIFRHFLKVSSSCLSEDRITMCLPSIERWPSVTIKPTAYANSEVHLKSFSGSFGFAILYFTHEVLEVGLEPTRISPYDFESYA